MTLKTTISLGLAMCIALLSSPSLGTTSEMIFWYPGEAGSTVDAQPFIDIFFEYVNKNISPEALEGKYFNTVPDGLKFIKDKKPILGIVSYSAFVQNKDLLKNAKVLLATLPTNANSTVEKYALVGAKDNCDSTIISSEPLALDYVRNNLFSNLSRQVTLQKIDQIVFELKKISEGSSDTCAILTPTEAITLQRMSAPWAKNLRVIKQSESVPTARLLLLVDSWDGTEELKKTLTSMNDDEEGREILNELRLKGFVKP